MIYNFLELKLNGDISLKLKFISNFSYWRANEKPCKPRNYIARLS